MIDARIRKRRPNGFELDVHFKTDSKSVVLIGPPGAGKTLLLECLCGFERPDEGRIVVSGNTVFDGAARISTAPERRGVAYIPSGGALLEHLSLRDNFALTVAPGGRLERRRKVDVMLDESGLSAHADDMPPVLDEGERLRASVARALLAAPRVLVIDEPEHGLDASLREEMQAAMEVASETRGVQVVLAGRSAESWLEIAQEAVVLQAGNLLRQSTPHDLLDEPELRDVALALGRHSTLTAEITAIDPARRLGRLRCSPDTPYEFEIVAPYFPGLMKGAHVQIALRIDRLTASSRGGDGIARVLERAVEGLRAVTLHFEGGLMAEVSRREWESQKHNRNWVVSIPPESVRLVR